MRTGYALSSLASHIGGELLGKPDVEISGVGTLTDAVAGEISFLSNRRYKKALPLTRASAVIVSRHDADQCLTNKIIVDDPYLGYAKVAALLYRQEQREIAGIASTAVIHDSVRIHSSAFIAPHCVIEAGADIGKNVYLGAGVSIGENVTIADGTRVQANVSIYSGTVIGQNALIHSGAVLGSDGFGVVKDTDGQWFKVPQLGRVVIGDHVEIGANTTIDRGTIGDTVLEDDVKLDNQVQVAHNVCIGAGTAIAGCVGISGSTKIGKRCLIGGGVGFVGHLDIADDVVVTGMTLVSKSITKPGVYSSGIPARAHGVWQKNMARLLNLDKVLNKLKN